MRIEVGYGKGTQAAEIPEQNIQAILTPNQVEHRTDEEGITADALKEPIGAAPLRTYDLKDKKIAVISSDVSRPMPTWKVMPLLLDELYAAGAQKENITLVFGLGSHREQTDEEKKRLAGDRAWEEITCEDSTAHGFVHLGETKSGTPVDIASTVANADFRICLGNIEYHYFAGYSGGAKAIMPGVSTPAAIQCNHSMMVQEDAHAGKIGGNPIREDIEEAAAMCGVDYILNVVLDEHKKIIYAVAGDVTEAHRAGCRFLDQFYLKELDSRADIVIVSQGGAPKDLNLYQTQKALDNAKHAVKEGGTVILVGACQEGLGNKKFQDWMERAQSPQDLIHWVQSDFQLGGHKAAAIAMVMEKADIYLISEMDPELVKSMFFTPFNALQPAVDAAMAKQGKDASIIVMPYGGSTLPRAKN